MGSRKSRFGISRQRRRIRNRVEEERPGRTIRWRGGVLYDMTDYDDGLADEPNEIFRFRDGNRIPRLPYPGKDAVGWDEAQERHDGGDDPWSPGWEF